jgi:hypothetical protein
MAEAPSKQSSLPDRKSQFKFSPFHAVLHDGIDRLLEMIQSEDFMFLVKGQEVKSTIAEAVLISPIIFEKLKMNPMDPTFSFVSDEISPKQLEQFLALIRDHNCESHNFSMKDELDFLSVCKSFGNDRLSLIILCSVHSNSTSDIVSQKIEFDLEIDIDSCASQFSSYSIDEVRNLSKQTLHNFLSSQSLGIESEDSLLQTLIDLGCDYFEFWCYIEVSFLSDEGISRFVDSLRFEELKN